MPRIILVVISVALLLIVVLKFRRLQLSMQKKIIKILLLLFVVVVFVLLAITGKLSWIAALLGSLVAFLPKLLSWLMRFSPALMPVFKRFMASRYGNSAASIYTTEYIKISLNILSGEMDGLILKGQFNGRQLSTLTKDELTVFVSECNVDRESSALLMAYLRRNRPDWKFTQERSAGQYDSSSMGRHEAAEILGVPETATTEEIIKAHRRLIQKFHPDRGGSDYLAAKINQAKDIMLG